MPTNTYTALATITIAVTDTEIVFASIPATYRDLVLVVSGQSTAANANMQARFNSDAGSNYSWVFMGGDGSSTFSGTGSGTSGDWGNFPNAQSVSVFQIMDYSATDKHKTTLVRSNTTATYAIAYANRWANTAAITSISLTVSGVANMFAAGTTLSLFGIAG
jgi:hypothetical protein